MSEQQQKKRSYRVIVPRPERMRRPPRSGFGWLDARLLKDGWLAQLSPQELSVYVFLCLVANAQGVSWYRRDRIREALNLHEDEVCEALERLCQLDLLAYLPFGRYDSEGFRQVLSVPPAGPMSQGSAILELWSPKGI